MGGSLKTQKYSGALLCSGVFIFLMSAVGFEWTNTTGERTELHESCKAVSGATIPAKLTRRKASVILPEKDLSGANSLAETPRHFASSLN